MTTQTTTVGSKNFKVKVKVKDMNGGVKAYLKVQNRNLKNANRAMADSILGRATMIAPKLTGALRSDGRVETRDTSLAIVFGDERVPYARMRHYVNRKNPQTLNYLKRAGDQTMKEGIKKYL